jgi:hypothetical protein
MDSERKKKEWVLVCERKEQRRENCTDRRRRGHFDFDGVGFDVGALIGRWSGLVKITTKRSIPLYYLPTCPPPSKREGKQGKVAS